MMLGAAIVHLRRREYPNVAGNLILVGLAAYLALERFGPLGFPS